MKARRKTKIGTRQGENAKRRKRNESEGNRVEKQRERGEKTKRNERKVGLKLGKLAEYRQRNMNQISF